MVNVNVLGLDTDDNISAYLSSRQIPKLTPKLPLLNGSGEITRRMLSDILKETGIKYNENQLNVVLGGTGLWHHLNLGILDLMHKSDDYDIINIDNHLDAGYQSREYIICCGTHLTPLIREGRKALSLSRPSSNRPKKLWLLENNAQYDEFSIRKTQLYTLEDALFNLKDNVYLTLDIDVLSEKEFSLRDSSFSRLTNRYDQGAMRLNTFLKYIGQIFSTKNVIGVNAFGLCNPRKTFNIYDRILETIEKRHN